jgi:hypothetical protein
LSRAPSPITVSAIHSAASSALELRTGLGLLSEEDLFVLANPQQRVLDCGSDLRCVSQRLRSLNADLGLIVVASEVDDAVLIDLRLIQTSDGRLIASDGTSYSASEGPLLEAITDRIGRLLDDAGHRRGGRLSVSVTPENARVWIDGVEERAVVVEAGEHVVRAAAEGHEDIEQRVTVEAGGSQNVSLSLEETESIASAWWLWTVIGVGIAGGVAGAIVAATRPDAIYCAGRGDRECE